MFKEKVELGGAGSTDGANRSKDCGDESWDASPEGQECP